MSYKGQPKQPIQKPAGSIALIVWRDAADLIGEQTSWAIQGMLQLQFCEAGLWLDQSLQVAILQMLVPSEVDALQKWELVLQLGKALVLGIEKGSNCLRPDSHCH